ncbi:tRNA threonylcarbamoyladenosine biosynthesis protein TsaB [Arsenophonus endosymbiont of Aleurodicus dispersus]|uniref:tRNA (adenosine(37)-N6)-threonylcarbamoyltransferase complex dimerization subunit type 1 TsaB n=1 Tax=Arsenophonus endosymbiont of Aleurodicus dispersus TaxID=235559 RepID=UPI000EB2D98D|nr:tRNA (adenosine(37)-N6)-threonylcarbamoyltransferase complex dimerization subunit type 1 TsaB [Arsenophonus endosymbiont of Aleurodicus dispersus]VAY02280.1 tRNA threonylcarbamoyladenosine biosynthesis protein TsaB [Arsenophonus endosymbiont of Aleurodicus dispersus]
MATHILAIDTATEACSVALWRDGKIFTKFAVSTREHTKIILPMVEQCLIDANLDLQHMDVLAFGRGPGSFTGVRIAVSIAQGLAFGADLPMIGISSLLTIGQGAYRQLGAEKVLVAIDARMGAIYSACYELKPDGNWLGEDTEAVLKPEQFLARINCLSGQWVIAGTGWSAYPILGMTNLNLLQSGIYLPDAQDMLILALKEWQKGKTIDAEEAKPVYLRNEVNWKKLPGC